MADLRVLLIADNPLARMGLSALLNEQRELTIVGQVSGGDNLLDDIDLYQPNILVWDLGWEAESAPERLADLGRENRPILALLADESTAAEAWAAGVRGLLPRMTNSDRLYAAVQAIAQGLVILDPAFTSALLPQKEETPLPPVEQLTPRESEVLQLLSEGLANKTIAQRLSISEHTVKFHVNAIMTKLGAQSRTEAVVRATRLGMIIL
jgi:two-component system, NarL family, nitrate/nitrite response regulator NarL